MSTKKKKHHFVSRFYLDGFVDPDHLPCLWIYDKKKKAITKASTSDAGCRTSFYAFPKKDGTIDTNSLEDMFGKLESQVAPLFKKISSREELTNDERSAISFFIALTLTKVPHFRSNLDSYRAQITKEIGMLMARKGGFEQIKDELAKKGKPIDENLHAKMIEVMEKGEFDVEVAAHASIEQFLRLAMALAPIIHKMFWTFLIPKGRYKFVTSDNPVAYADPTHDPMSPIGVGLKSSNVELTFPITRELAIFAGWKKVGSLYRRATEATVKAINVRTVSNSQRFVYASSRDDGFAKLVWEYSRTAPTVKIDAVHKEKRSLFIFRGTALKDQTNLRRLVCQC